MSDEAEADPSPRRHRRVRIVVAIALGVVLAGVATFAILLSRVSSRPVTIDEARQRADEAGQGTELSTDEVDFRPAAGVYEYRGEGTERLDRPPTNQSQGPEIPGTVTHLDDRCWRFRVDYNVNHWQSWDYCAGNGRLTEHAGQFFQKLDLVVTQVETLSTVTCDPPVDAIRPDQEAGDQWTQECRGTSEGTAGEVVSAGPYTFVGPEILEIDGRDVDALHYRRARELSGGQTGTEDIDLWFAADTALPLRNERDVTVRSESLIGGVTYTERGSFTLVSMTPVSP
jgi:hypothetical protein